MMTGNDSSDSARIPVHEAGLVIAELDLHGGPGFWEEVARFSGETRLGGHLDRIMAGKSAPRTWVFLDAPRSSATRCAAALAVARALSERGQTVIVIDGDDQRPDLTRWAGRFEEEGWVDYLRYGASVSACSVDLPWPGRGRLLGVGSFCPTQVTGEEVDRLLARLRHQADDLLVVAPAADSGRLWLPGANLRFLCWDRMQRSAERTRGLVKDLQDLGILLDGLIAFGAEESALAMAPSAAGDALDVLPVPAQAVAAYPAHRPADDQGAPAAEDEGVAGTAALAAVAEPNLLDPAALVREPAAKIAESIAGAEQARRSSRLFWGLASVLAIAVIGIGIWWFSVSRWREPSDQTLLAHQDGNLDISASASPPPHEGTSPGRGDAQNAAGVHEMAQPAAAAAGTETDSVVMAPVTEGVVRSSPAGQDVPSDLAAETPAAADDPFQAAVGAQGWAVHVSSHSARPEAEAQIERLAKLGIKAVWRQEDIPGKGRWYRVYVGSFGSSEAATAAIPELTQRLKISWARAKRF